MPGKIGEMLRGPRVRNLYHILIGTELRRNLHNSAGNLAFQKAAFAGMNSGFRPKITEVSPQHIMFSQMRDNGGKNTGLPGAPSSQPKKNIALEICLNDALEIKKSKWVIGLAYAGIISISVFPFPIVAGALGIGLPLVLAAPLLHIAYHYYVKGKTNRAWERVNELVKTPAGKEELARLIVASKGKIDLNRIPLSQSDKKAINGLIEGIKMLAVHRDLEERAEKGHAGEIPLWLVDRKTAEEKINPLLAVIPEETETHRQLQSLLASTAPKSTGPTLERIGEILGTTYDSNKPAEALALARKHREELGQATGLNDAQKQAVEKHIKEVLDPEIARLEKALAEKKIFLSDNNTAYEVVDPAPREGGMADVYKVRDPNGNIRALKRFRLPKDIQKIRDVAARTARIQELHGRFMDEISILKKLQALRHSSIPILYDAKAVGDEPFMVMEWIETPLKARVGERGLQTQEALEIFEPLTEVLARAHEELQIYNLDVKVGNTLITDAGTPKLTDWGIAKDELDPTDRTRTDEIIGTESHLPPEVWLRGRKNVADKSKMDVYMVGMALYQTLTGELPFKLTRENMGELTSGKLVGSLSKPLGMDEEVFSLIRSALDADPAKRPSARELHEKIAGMLKGEGKEETGRIEVTTGQIESELPDSDIELIEPLTNSKDYQRDLESIVSGAMPFAPEKILPTIERAKKVKKENPALAELAETAMDILYELYKGGA